MAPPVALSDFPEEIIFRILEDLNVDSSINLIQTCKTLHQLAKTHTLWLLLCNKLDDYRPVGPTNRHAISVDDLRSSVVSAYRLTQGWPLKQAPWRVLPALGCECPVPIDEWYGCAAWMAFLQDGKHIIYSERDYTFKLRRLDTGAVVHSFSMEDNYRFLELAYCDDGFVMVMTPLQFQDDTYGTISIWHVPWDPASNPKRVHTREIPGLIQDNVAKNGIVGCVSLTQSGLGYIYLFEWKTGHEILVCLNIAVVEVTQRLYGCLTPTSLVLLYGWYPLMLEFVSFDVAHLLSQASKPMCELELEADYYFDVPHPGDGLPSRFYYPVLVPTWDNRIAVFLRTGTIAPSLGNWDYQLDDVVYSIVVLDIEDIKKVGATTEMEGSRPIARPCLQRRIAVLKSLDGFDICVHGRGGKSMATLTGPYNNTNVGEKSIPPRLRIYDVPARDEDFGEELSREVIFADGEEDGLQLEGQNLGRMRSVQVDPEVLGNRQILCMDVDDAAGRVAFSMADGDIIIMDCFPDLSG